MKNEFISEFLLQSFQLILFLLLVGFLGIYIFNKELLFFIAHSVGLSGPIFLLFIIYLFLTIGKIKKIKKRRNEEEGNISDESIYSNYKSIYINNTDEMKNDFLAFLTAILIIIIAQLINGSFDYSDILQAILAFLAIYATKDIYFKKGIFGVGNNKIEKL